MVYQDYWAITQWYRHFEPMLGAENLFVVVHGPDDVIATLCPNANILHVPRDDLTKFDRRRSVLLSGIASGLRALYTHVIQTDADELICYDPDLYDSLSAALAAGGHAPALFALGANLMQMPDDADYDESKPLGAQRRSVWFSGHYSKAFVTSGHADLWRHGVKVLDQPLRSFDFTMPRGLFLMHLKFANLKATQSANTVREAVANPADGNDRGLPGDAWKFARDDTRKLLDEHYAREAVDWDSAEAQAYTEISQHPRRMPKIGLIKAKSFKWPVRAELPDRLAQQLAPIP